MPALLTVVAPADLSGGEKLKVKIVGRQTGTSIYTYVVPGYSQTQMNSQAGCGVIGTTTANPIGSTTVATANCSGRAASTTLSRPAMVGSYQVVGATFTLLLPDGRRALVNCNSKANFTEWGRGPRLGCRMPLVDEIEVGSASACPTLDSAGIDSTTCLPRDRSNSLSTLNPSVSRLDCSPWRGRPNSLEKSQIVVSAVWPPSNRPRTHLSYLHARRNQGA